MNEYEIFLNDVNNQTRYLAECLLNANISDTLEFRIVGVEGQVLPLIMKYGIDVYRRANREVSYKTIQK